MKKVSVTIFLSVLLIGVLDAQSQVVTSFRWWNTTPGSLTDADGANIPDNDATVLTFLTPDSAFDPVAAMDPALFSSWAEVASTFSLYRAEPSGLVGRFATSMMTEEQPEDFAVGQYAWAIVLDMPFASYSDIASIDNQIFYGVAGLSPQINNLDTVPAGTAQSFGGFFVQTTEVIPEPSVLALLGLGGLLMVVRRRFVRS